MALKRGPVEPTSTGSKGKTTDEAQMAGTKGKRSNPQRSGGGKQKTSAEALQASNKGKRPVLEESFEIRKKATFDRSSFTTPQQAQRFHLHFANQTVIPGRNIDFAKLSHFHFDVLFARMGWLPIVSVKEFLYPKVVKCFYSNMTFEDEGPITITINGVQIVFDVAELCQILEIPNEGVCLYEAKKWPRVEGFKPAEAIHRLCGYPRTSRPTSHLLTVLSRILQHMISYIFIPKGGHRDDVSFLEAFLVDSILTERKVNIGYIIFQHMKACSMSEDSVLPYGMFITKIVKYFNVNLRNETDGKKLKSFDTYDRASLRRMHFVRKKDGSWARKSSVPPSEVDVSSDNGSSEDEEIEDQDVEGRTSEYANVTRIPSTGGVRDRADVNHPSLVGTNDSQALDNLNVQISSLGTRLEEIVLANDRRLTSLENRIDGLHDEVKDGM
ncbi:hypothetical protein PVL29_026148 [Vitis rotundifolia]|uniref:Putative plant transposon protein domain-containing protein n=1 Tax=Vitis rotundifolia TaxID=103349 RepID=A0AA38YLR2_VITRO|nr:hypothetical protein PVL29_026148 [Vitis rotundifolia]